jgi:hypothetical protein
MKEFVPHHAEKHGFAPRAGQGLFPMGIYLISGK